MRNKSRESVSHMEYNNSLTDFPVALEFWAWQCHGSSRGMILRKILLYAAGAAFFPIQLAHAAAPADPQGSGVILNAVNWLQGTLLGTVATVVAVIAIAAVGFMMLTGRINWRHGAVVVLGCFILFGAASIVAGIRTALSD
jgi:type IV secretory pathway VirB2 component (pilin)